MTGKLYVRAPLADVLVEDLGLPVASGLTWLCLSSFDNEIPLEASGQYTSVELKNSRDLYDKIISGDLEWSMDGISATSSGLYSPNYALVEDIYEDILERGDMAARLTLLLDEDGSYTYVGEASPGTATSAASWRIYRLDESASGDEELIKKWANGSTDFDQVWDNRVSLGYS